MDRLCIGFNEGAEQAERSTGPSRRQGRRRVHPHAGGEISRGSRPFDFHQGSSPRRRGDHQAGGAELRPSGFIPAQAGRSMSGLHDHRLDRVHPRAGGEIAARPAMAPTDMGSSPRRRGDPDGERRRRQCSGFIPAQAGRSNAICSSHSRLRVHPRAGGEISGYAHPLYDGAGSSPRRRGDLRADRLSVREGGFIPAQAGRSPGRPSLSA